MEMERKALIEAYEIALIDLKKGLDRNQDFRSQARMRSKIQFIEATLEGLQSAQGNDVLIKAPETGLVPCGCKGKAILLTDRTCDAVKYAVACEECFIGLPFAFDDPEAAKRAWNRARGYREDGEE